MNHFTQTPAAIVQPTPQQLVLLGALTVLGVGQLDQQLEALTAPVSTAMVVDGRAVEGLDTAVFAADRADLPAPKTPSPEMQPEKMLARIGQGVIVIGEQALALLGFLGESAVALGGNMTLMGIVIANQTASVRCQHLCCRPGRAIDAA